MSNSGKPSATPDAFRTAIVIAVAVSVATGLVVNLSGEPSDVAPKPAALRPVAVARAGAEQGRPPNILLVIADDLGVDQVGAYGEGEQPARTPTIDALAGRGVLFRNAWSNPVCSSTRATILTGRYSFRTGVGFVARPGAELKDREHTLPEILARHPSANYGTAAFGKWHLNAIAAGTTDRLYLTAPLRAGFSHFQGSFENIRNRYDNWEDVKVAHVGDGNVKIEGPDMNKNYNTSEIVNYAGQWIRDFETRRPDDPWFVWLAFNAAHDPYHKPPAELHQVDLSDPGITCENDSPHTHPERLLPCYQAMVEAMDTELGRLLNREMSAESLSRTTVIFLGDNGTITEVARNSFLASHAKGTTYEGGVNVPLVIAGALVETSTPGGGRESEVLVNTTDLFATVLELAGLDVDASVPSRYGTVPGTPAPIKDPSGLDELDVVLDSQSLLPQLLAKAPEDATEARGFAYTELYRLGPPDPRYAISQAIRDARGFKLIRFYETHDPAKSFELYDLANDPDERVNLIGPNMSEEARRAQLVLHERLDVIDTFGWRPHGG